jgi:hypothetical protein
VRLSLDGAFVLETMVRGRIRDLRLERERVSLTLPPAPRGATMVFAGEAVAAAAGPTPVRSSFDPATGRTTVRVAPTDDWCRMVVVLDRARHR